MTATIDRTTTTSTTTGRPAGFRPSALCRPLHEVGEAGSDGRLATGRPPYSGRRVAGALGR